MKTYKIVDKNSTIYEFENENQLFLNSNSVNIIPSSNDEYFYINNIIFHLSYEKHEKGKDYTINIFNQKKNIIVEKLAELKVEIYQENLNSDPILSLDSNYLSGNINSEIINYISFFSDNHQEEEQEVDILKGKDELYLIFEDGQTLTIKNISFIQGFTNKDSTSEISFYVKTKQNKIYFIQNISSAILVNSEKRIGKQNLIIHQNGGKISIPNIKRTDIAFSIQNDNINITTQNDDHMVAFFLRSINAAYLEPSNFMKISESGAKNITGVVSV